MKPNLLVLLAVLFLAQPAHAGVQEGIAALTRSDYATALREFQPLAEQGNVNAQFNLGFMYHEGLGVPQDYAQAIKWFRKAAELGNAKAQFYLGVMYVNGQAVPQDYPKAYMWFNLAAANATGKVVQIAVKYRDITVNYMTPEQLAEARRLAAAKERTWSKGTALPFVAEQDRLAEAKLLNQKAVEFHGQGQYIQATEYAKRALAIFEKALGPDHPDTVKSLNNLAELYRTQGAFSLAEPLLKRALAISEKALGPDHPDTASSLKNLALLYQTQGSYSQAEPLFKRALAINEKALGPEHPDTAQSLHYLAMLNEAQGSYSRAEPLYKRALAIREKALGPDHPYVAQSLNNLADLYGAQGFYSRAEPLFKRALAIFEKAFGPNHPATAASLNNLALLYRALGSYSRSVSLAQRALAITEKAQGPNHPDTATQLNNLAGLYKSRGSYSQAEPLYQRALAISEKAQGPNHPDTATSLNNLASLYVSQGSYSQAEPLFKRALAIIEKALGSDHPQLISELNNLALLYRAQGSYSRAVPLLQRALAICEKTLGPDHPNTAASLNNLAFLKVTTGERQDAHLFQLRALAIEDKLIAEVLGYTSEQGKLSFLATTERSLACFLTLVIKRLSQEGTARKQALDIWLRRKGVVLQAQKSLQEALVDKDNPRAADAFQELSQVRVGLSHLIFKGPGKVGPQAYRNTLKELNKRKDALEARLSRLSQTYAASRRAARADAQTVARAMPAGSVLVDLARVDMFDFQATGKESKWLPAHYLAFVLQAGGEAKVDLIDLGEAETIDRAVGEYKRQLKIKWSDQTREAGQMLHALVFAPLTKSLGDARSIFLSPDGNLSLIPFEVMLDKDGRFLIERYTFNYLKAGRDVAAFGQATAKKGPPLLMGNPDYDLPPGQRDEALHGLGLNLRQMASARSADARNLIFKPLPNTRAEVEAVAKLLGPEKAEVFIGRRALEEVLYSRPSPRILHLATHGFFLSDLDLASLAVNSGRPAFRGFGKDEVGEGYGAIGARLMLENPLLRSGIALAGANQAVKHEGGAGDGLVTAEKILGLRLRGTELVVLSACETGLGKIKTSEGVFGLCRAFTQAGAKSLVMSMWSVPDLETKELMEAFYRNYLERGLDRCQALRQAALSQMEVVRKRHGFPHPYYWGAFVFLGQAN